MIKKTLCLVLCLPMALFCVSCHSRQEPKNMAVTNSILYDVLEDGRYKVTAEIMNPTAAGGTQDTSGSEKSPSITVSGEGDSIREAVSDLTVSVERSFFGGHNKTRFFSERFAKAGMSAVLDFLLRDHLADETPLMIVIQGQTPEDINFSSIGLSDLVGDYFESMGRNQPGHMAESIFSTTLDFVKDYYEAGKEPVAGLAMIETCEEKPSGNVATDSKAGEGGTGKTNIILYEGLAAFKGTTLVGYMDGHEARAYNLLTKNIDTAIITVPTGQDPFVLEIDSSNADISTALSGERVSIDIRVKIVMRVVTAADMLDVRKSGPLSILEQRFNEQIEKEIAAAIHKAQHQFHSDIFGFGSHFHTQHPKVWREIQDEWDGYFTDAQVSVTVESSINREGEIKQPFEMEDVGE